MKQWETVRSRRASPMTLDETLTVGAATYKLHGVICHKGETPAAGHYVAVVRHGAAEEQFFLYMIPES